MPLTIEEALRLAAGTALRFEGNTATYEVITVARDGKGVRLSLLRDDGYETHASTHDLRKATIVPPAATPPVDGDDPVDRDLPVKRTKRAKG